MTDERDSVRRRTRRHASPRRITDEALREACARSVAHRSLRAVARDIGISPPGLSQFLNGSKPRSETLQKLRDWFYSGAVAAWLTPAHVEATLAEILNSLCEPDRTNAALQICEIVRDAHRRQRTPIPPWVETVTERLRVARANAGA